LEGEAWFLNPRGCGCRDALERAFDRHNLQIRVAAEVFGENLQLSLVANSGGLRLVPYRQLERSSHRNALRVLAIADFQLSAAITLLSSSTPSRFDAAIRFLGHELNSKLSEEAGA
jgi:DNA-binding transcriptional LysR family regulator